MQERTYCAVLGKEIMVTRSGWDHLFAGSILRPRKMKDKINRLALLKAAKYTIKNSVKAVPSTRNGQKYYSLEAKFENSKLIDVIIKQDKQGKLLFHSVFEVRKK